MALMAGALAGVLFAGTAHAATSAAPSYKPVLTKNPLYKTGKLGISACEEPQVQNGTVEEAELYFEAVMECLDKAWSPVVKKAGYRFNKAKVTVITKLGAKTPCGAFNDPRAQAMYCPPNKRMYILLSPQVIAEPNDLALMQVLAHEYGHHVQQLTGIMGLAYKSYYQRPVNEHAFESIRRAELQAECLSGAFVGRVWNSLGRPDSDWSIFLKGGHNLGSSLGLRSGSDETHGSDANVRWWLQKGFKAQSASACNTWTAPSRKVY
ncbi:YpfJ protein, zinc metalloprotease superfamily [[Actinomadura] parvosata subsp. kistnae]|nr:YpfJ protein, zinc metalloprotease superfamily [Actinomadura parvosata subsp. kistnae]